MPVVKADDARADDTTKGNMRPMDRKEITALEISRRLRGNIRAIEGNLGYIRPTVNRSATFSEASTEMRRKFILHGVNGVKETLTMKMRLEPQFVEHSLLRDRGRTGNTRRSGGRNRTSILDSNGTEVAVGLDGGDGLESDSFFEGDEAYKVQLNRLVKMLKSSRTYQSSFKASGDEAVPAPAPSPAGSPRITRKGIAFPEAVTMKKRSGEPGITLPPMPMLQPMLHTPSDSSPPSISRRNSSETPNDDYGDLPPFWQTAEFHDHVKQQTQAKFSELDAQGTGRVAMRAVQLHMQTDAGFAEGEVSALLAGVKVGIGGSGLLTYGEFHELCLFALLGEPSRALQFRDSSIYTDTDA
jgi:hypothetical protein